MYHKKSERNQITQGDIFQNFNYVQWAEKIGDELEIDEIEIPFFVVLTQCCDLEWDFVDRKKSKTEKRDKYIQSLLVCPAYIAELVKSGKHLENLGLIMENYNHDRWKIIENNNNVRYHFLKGNSTRGIPDLVLDFKQYYTIPTSKIYELDKEHYVASLKPLFRENLSQRFAFYLSRIGLPPLKTEVLEDIKEKDVKKKE